MNELKTNIYPFKDCPRQLGIPYRINCFSEQQFFREFNKHNGRRRRLYHSIFKINNDGNFDNTNIDCVPFDLDSDKCLDNIRKFYKYCEKHNYKSMFMFSTKGFWAFIKTYNGNNLKYPKQALTDAQKHIAKEMGLTIGQSKEADIDTAIVGDIARITRAVNSKDFGRKRFCIILKKEELFKTYEEICELAKKPRFEYYIYGDTRFDIAQFDKKKAFSVEEMKKKIVPKCSLPEKKEITVSNLKCGTDVSKFLPCVKSWLCNPHKGVWKARYFTGVYLAQTGKLPPEAKAICEKYFSKAPRSDRLGNNWNHMVKDATLKKAYKEDKMFPNCDTLIQQNLCPCPCEKYSGENSPLYYFKKEED